MYRIDIERHSRTMIIKRIPFSGMCFACLLVVLAAPAAAAAAFIFVLLFVKSGHKLQLFTTTAISQCGSKEHGSKRAHASSISVSSVYCAQYWAGVFLHGAWLKWISRLFCRFVTYVPGTRVPLFNTWYLVVSSEIEIPKMLYFWRHFFFFLNHHFHFPA